MRKQLDPAVRDVIEQANRLVAGGEVGAALELYAKTFEALLARSDHFGASNAAHMAGVAEPDPQAKLAWNQRALEEAERVEDRESVAGFYPSLYNNLAFSYSRLGDESEARRCILVAWSHIGALEPGPYADRVREAIRKRLAKLGVADLETDQKSTK